MFNMEKMGERELATLVGELKLGKELARELQIHLSSPTSSMEDTEMFVQKILDSFNKAISVLNSTCSFPLSGDPATNVDFARGMSDSSPVSLSGSPKSEDFNPNFMDQNSNKDVVARKRKNTPRWTHKVRVSPINGLEASLHDGYSWRKYGQKDILGAKYPRGYYRCTYRNVQGCLATKQIQKSDDDHSIFEVTYRGMHTCNISQLNNPLPPPATQMENQEQINTGTVSGPTNTREFNSPNPQEADLFNLVGDLSLIKQEGCMFDTHLVPPSTSGSGGFFIGGGHESIQNPDDSELSKIVNGASEATRSTNSQAVGISLPIGSQFGFETSFTFDNPRFHD